MKKIVCMVLTAVVLTGCSKTAVPSTPVVQEKAVNTTLTGTVTKSGTKFYIQPTGKPTTELDSYTVKLDQYVGQKVSATGQYSGTTLFVDTVEPGSK